MNSVLVSEPDEGEEGEEQKERVMFLASGFPGRDLGGVSFSYVEINTSVEPMSVVINMEVVKNSELIHRMVLEVVNLDHFVFSGLTLILVSLSVTVLAVFERL